MKPKWRYLPYMPSLKSSLQDKWPIHNLTRAELNTYPVWSNGSLCSSANGSCAKSPRCILLRHLPVEMEKLFNSVNCFEYGYNAAIKNLDQQETEELRNFSGLNKSLEEALSRVATTLVRTNGKIKQILIDRSVDVDFTINMNETKVRSFLRTFTRLFF